MKTVKVLGICENIKDKLFGNVKVAGIYNKCFNLLTDTGELLTVFVNTDFISTRGIVTEYGCSMHEMSLYNGECGYINHESILLGDICFDMSEARTIKTKREPRGFSNSPRIDALEKFIKCNGQASPLLQESSIIFQKAKKGFTCFAGGYEYAFDKLVGLGIGLTPSCDDLLGGMAAWFYLTDTHKQFNASLREYLIHYGDEKTTFVSKHLLLDITNGYINDTLFSLISSLFYRGADIEENARKMLKYGSSSGTELCIGILQGYNFERG